MRHELETHLQTLLHPPPVDLDYVAEWFDRYARRTGLEPLHPDDLEDDLEGFSTWAACDFVAAARHLRDNFQYRRIPTLAEFKTAARETREERRRRIDGLRKLLVRLSPPT